MARRKLTKHTDPARGTVTLTVVGQEPITVRLDDLPEEIIRRAALHGIAQKLGDAVAGASARGDTAADMANTITALADRLREGRWNAGATAGGGLLAEAIAALTGRDPGTVRAKLADMSEEDKKALAKRPDVAAMVARIRAERLAERAADAGPLEL